MPLMEARLSRSAIGPLKINDAAFRSRVSSKAAIINTFLNGQTMGSRTAGLSNQNIANVINYVYSQLNTPVIAQDGVGHGGGRRKNIQCHVLHRRLPRQDRRRESGGSAA